MNKVVCIKTSRARILMTNYGSFLQHWALRTILTEMGFTAIRYCDKNDVKAVTALCQVKLYSTKLARIILHYLKAPACSSKADSVYSLRKIKANRLFRTDYLKCIGPLVEKSDGEVYATIVGGDQVVYPYEISSSLQIKSLRHIIFGASADWINENQSETWWNAMNGSICKYDAIGLRETKGVEMLSHCCDQKTIARVADPVLLVRKQQLLQLSGGDKYFKSDTLFAYFVNMTDDSQLPIGPLNELSSNMNCELAISGIQGAEVLIPSQNYVCPSPHEFVRAIADSKFLITNSYHGTVLALMLHTPFVTIRQSGRTASQNTRQEELLDFFNLQNHLITIDDLINSDIGKLSQSINWDLVDESLESTRNFSRDWLKEAL